MHHIWGHGVAKNGNPTRCYFDQVTCSSVVSSIMHVPCLSTVAPQELFVKCVGSCWQRLGALTTEPRSLGVRISTCHRHPQKLVYYARKAHQAALVSTSMNAVSTATKTQGKPNHWLSQLETKHNKAMYCTVFGMHIVGHIMARSENPWKGRPQRNRHTPAGR